MIALRPWKSILVVVALLVLLAGYLVMKLPLSYFFSDEMNEMGITDIDGASLSGGDLWVSHPSIPGLLRVEYVWCPGSGIGSWCLNVENELVNVTAVVTPRADVMLITDANIQRLSSQLFGAVGGLVEGLIVGNIQQIKFNSYQCPLQYLEEFSGQLKVTQLTAFGSSMGDHQIVARNAGEKIEVKISGQSVDGTINLSGGAYEAKGELQANPQIEAMARSFMRSLGSSRYGWEINGKIPC